jgi:hypothetical protein
MDWKGFAKRSLRISRLLDAKESREAMPFSKITITRGTRKNRSAQSKGREFTVTLLGYVCADSLWELGAGGEAMRPVWIAYVGPDQAVRAFTANFRAGRKARSGALDFEIPKSSPHRFIHHRHGETTLTVAYLPEPFHLEPAVSPAEIGFVFMPPTWWLDEQAEALRSQYGERSREIARAALFAAYLDRRSPLPLIQDLDFHHQLFSEAQRQLWIHSAERQGAIQQDGVAGCGLEPPLLCLTSHETFETFLVDQTNAYFAKEIRHGKNRIRPDRRLLPYPSGAATQLRLDFQVA